MRERDLWLDQRESLQGEEGRVFWQRTVQQGQKRGVPKDLVLQCYGVAGIQRISCLQLGKSSFWKESQEAKMDLIQLALFKLKSSVGLFFFHQFP